MLTRGRFCMTGPNWAWLSTCLMATQRMRLAAGGREPLSDGPGGTADVVNTAKNRGMRESRTVPCTSVAAALDDVGPTVDPSRFQGRGDQYPGHWREPPPAWPSAESQVVAAEVRAHVEAALRELPYRQRAVITLRDVEGYGAEEVCSVLGISAGNQRVLLHRARAAVRARLAEYFAGAAACETGAVG